MKRDLQSIFFDHNPPKAPVQQDSEVLAGQVRPVLRNPLGTRYQLLWILAESTLRVFVEIAKLELRKALIRSVTIVSRSLAGSRVGT